MSADATLARLKLNKVAERRLWEFAIDRRLCLGAPGSKHLSGGACVAAMVAVLEAETDKPLIQASAQFLSAPRFGASACVSADILSAGRNIVQARAKLNGLAACRVHRQIMLGLPHGDLCSV